MHRTNIKIPNLILKKKTRNCGDIQITNARHIITPYNFPHTPPLIGQQEHSQSPPQTVL
jgi:hypothetical protein